MLTKAAFIWKVISKIIVDITVEQNYVFPVMAQLNFQQPLLQSF